MSSEKKNYIPYSPKTAAEKKHRRHETYKLMSTRKKEAQLLQQQRITQQPALFPKVFRQQNELLESPISPTTHDTNITQLETMTTTSPMQTNPFYSFEVGSTSGTCRESYNRATSSANKKGHNRSRKSTSTIAGTCNDNHTTATPTAAGRDRSRSRKLTFTPIGQRRSTYVPLKTKKLNPQQQMAYNVILDRIFSNKAGAFFIDGPGGTALTSTSCTATGNQEMRPFWAADMSQQLPHLMHLTQFEYQAEAAACFSPSNNA